MPIDTAEKRRAVSALGFWILPEVTPNAAKDAEWRAEAAFGYAFLILVVPPAAAGTDRKVYPTKKPKWEPVDTFRFPYRDPIHHLKQRIEADRTMRLQNEAAIEAERLVRVDAQARAKAIVDSEREAYLVGLDRREKSLFGLELANRARAKKREAADAVQAQEAERQAEINRNRLANLKKANRAKRKKK